MKISGKCGSKLPPYCFSRSAREYARLILRVPLVVRYLSSIYAVCFELVTSAEWANIKPLCCAFFSSLSLFLSLAVPFFSFISLLPTIWRAFVGKHCFIVQTFIIVTFGLLFHVLWFVYIGLRSRLYCNQMLRHFNQIVALRNLFNNPLRKQFLYFRRL